MLYKADNLYFKYEKQVDYILENISFEINKESRIGLIGRNGAGKSTLIKILLEKLNISKGSILKDKKIVTGYLKQSFSDINDISVKDFIFSVNIQVSAIKKILEDAENLSEEKYIEYMDEYYEIGGYDHENRFEIMANKFGFSEDFLVRDFSSLSGGEKTKAALCRVMMKNPDIIFLDEPTNHLDEYYLNWLEEYINSEKIPFIIISHDRRFLDNTVNTIWELKNKDISVYSGNYTFYKKQIEDKYANDLKKFNKTCLKIKQLKTVADNKKIMAGKRENFKAPRSVKKNGGLCKRDMGKVKVIRRENSIMKNAMAVTKRVENLLKSEKSKKPVLEKEVMFKFSEAECRKNDLLEVRDLSFGFEEKNLFENISFSLKKGDRIIIKGRNGSGKSTLLNILTEKIKSYSGYIRWASNIKVSYFEQERPDLDNNKTILEEFDITGNEEEGRARKLLGCLGIRKDMVFNKIGILSEGEKRKVFLAKLLFNENSVLILDEPANHFEVEILENLEKAFLDFSGGIIFVSHDRVFNEKVKNKEINI